MTRLGHLLRGLAALGLLAALVVGIPWALWHFVGWPLPHHVPSAGQVGRALDHQGIPDQSLVDALAVVVWITWAVLVTSIAVEVPAALSGRHAPRLPLAGIFQPITGRLVVAVMIACLTLAPRPGHPSAPGSAGGGLSAATVRQPFAALVVHDTALKETVLTDTGRPLAATTPSAPASSVASSPPNATAAAPLPGAATTYVVQRGDTLWGIAEEQLGEPLRWSEIYQLNEGRPQPDGATLTDPHWIDPGWTLVLPSSSSPVTWEPAPTPSPPPPPATPGAPTTTTQPATTMPLPVAAPTHAHPATTPTTVPSPSTEPRPATFVPAARERGPSSSATRRAGTTGAPVRLPSGSMVAGSFAAGVLSAVAVGRLRRRHAYRYRPPEPGRNLAPEPLRPTLRHLAHAGGVDAAHEDTTEHEELPSGPFDDAERRQDPGRLDFGTRNGESVTVEITDLSGIALCGPATDDIARALVAGLVVRAGPGAAEILITASLGDRLLPGLDSDQAIRRAKTVDDLARALQSEIVARTRRLDSAEAPDARNYRAANPENPLPLLVALLDGVPADSVGRWSALLESVGRLAIAIVFLGDSPAATGRLSTDASRIVTDSSLPVLIERLTGAQLFGLRGDEVVELLGAVADSHRDGGFDEVDLSVDEPIVALHPSGGIEQPTPPSERGGEPWPETDLVEEGQDRPIVVQMLGPLRITAHSEPVTIGLRSRAKDLFAWYLLRPEGATSDEAVDALWPDTTPERVLKQFWRAFGDLRSRFREPRNDALDVLTKTGEYYQPCAAEIACDLWEFQSSLAEAARATDDDHARAALRRTVDTYRGDLLQGADYPWVEPVRQDLHRRALDAHIRLADLEDHTGHPDAAVDTLERAIELDRYAEEPYRRLMALHAVHGRLDAVSTTWKLLHTRLADLDLDVEPATTRLYRTLITTDSDAADRQHPIRLSS
jgi:DNA-binding SARP family transcriptional activator